MNELISSLLLSTILVLVALYLGYLLYDQYKRSEAFSEFQHLELVGLQKRSERFLSESRLLASDNKDAWQGFRKFEIIERTEEDAGKQICSFYLKPHDGGKVPLYRPGQFLTFQLKVPDPVTPNKFKNVVRCYSLSDSPGKETYRVSIKRCPPPRDKPELPRGLSSNYFHEELKNAMSVDVRAPSGSFYLQTQSERPVVLIGGGVGLTPMVSMLNYLVETKSEREVWFFYGVVNDNDHIWREHFNAIRSDDNNNINIVVCYSNPAEDNVLRTAINQHGDYDFAGRIGIDLFKEKLATNNEGQIQGNNYEFYMCGPPPMMNSVVEALEDWGVPEDDIHYEAFGPASVGKKEILSEPIDIEFTRSGKTLSWDGSHDSLLVLAESAEISIPFACRAGNCGMCSTALVEGKVKYKKSPGAQVEKNSFLPCCSSPTGPMKVDA
jgi:ferredoxin-NADP reductase